MDNVLNNSKFSKEGRYTIGHHGTTSLIAEQIISAQKFIDSDNEDSHLGKGVYFYESSPKWAKKWADLKYIGKETSVIEAFIVLGKCIDLCDFDTVGLIKTAALSLAWKLKEKISMGAVINHFAEKKAVETVRAIQQEKENWNRPIVEGSPLYSGLRIIICVKNHGKIKEPKII